MDEPVKRVAVVLNGKAGAVLDGEGTMAERVAAALAEAGLDATFIPLDRGTLPERIRLALAMTPDAVLVAGGDGTVTCAAQAMAGKAVPLALLPLGTMNLLATDLNLPIGDVAAAVRAVAGGQLRTIDVGDVNGHAFLCASMLGLPAQLGRYREASRGASLRLWSRMARATWRLLSHGRRLRVRVALDGAAAGLSAAALTVTVNPVDEAGGRPFGRSKLDGGTLCLYVVERLRLWDLLRLAVRFASGGVRADSAVAEHHAREVDIDGAGRRGAMRVMNDGELVLLRPPLRYRVRPCALAMLAAP